MVQPKTGEDRRLERRDSMLIATIGKAENSATARLEHLEERRT